MPQDRDTKHPKPRMLPTLARGSLEISSNNPNLMELLGMLATLGAARAKTYKEAPREEDTASDTDHHMDATI